eukprot:360853-Chlamydomonas_euryale.AAC.6
MSHAVPRLRRHSASLRSTADQPDRPAAAAPLQRPRCLPAPGALGRRPDDNLYPTAQMCAAAGVPQHMLTPHAARLHVSVRVRDAERTRTVAFDM